MLPIHTRRHPHMRSGRNSRSVRDGRGFINAVTPVHAPRRPFTHRAAIHTVLSIHALRYPFTHRATRLRTATPTHAQWQEPPFGARRQELYQRSDTCSRTAPSIHTPRRPFTHRAAHSRTALPVYARRHPHMRSGSNPRLVRDGRSFINTVTPVHEPHRPFTHCAAIYTVRAVGRESSAFNTLFPSLTMRICTHQITQSRAMLPIHARCYPFTHGDTHTCTVAATPVRFATAGALSTQ